MIIDSLSESEKYFGLHPLFKQAFEYVIASYDTIVEGRYDILDNNQLYVMVSDGQLRKKEESPLEAHNSYIDIQIPLSKPESYGWRSRNRCYEEQAEYNKQKDIIFYDDAPTSYIVAEPGEFVLFFPEDAHAPMVGKGAIKKIVIKIAVK